MLLFFRLRIRTFVITMQLDQRLHQRCADVWRGGIAAQHILDSTQCHENEVRLGCHLVGGGLSLAANRLAQRRSAMADRESACGARGWAPFALAQGRGGDVRRRFAKGAHLEDRVERFLGMRALSWDSDSDNGVQNGTSFCQVGHRRMHAELLVADELGWNDVRRQLPPPRRPRAPNLTPVSVLPVLAKASTLHTHTRAATAYLDKYIEFALHALHV